MTRENPNVRMYGTMSPVQRMLLNPKEFDPDKLTVNEIEQDNGLIIAKIPNIPGRITRRKKNNSDEYYIELVLSQHYDPETKQNRNKKVIIGTDVSYWLRGMMFANDNYHEYFNIHGEVLPHIIAQWAEEGKQKRKTEQPNPQAEAPVPTQNKPTHIIKTTNNSTKDNPPPNSSSNIPTPIPDEPEEQPEEQPEEEGEASEVQLKELREREKALEAREKELDKQEKELESRQTVYQIKMDEAIRDHITFLRDILDEHKDIVEAQAKRRPDKPMSIRQIRTINEPMQELRELFKGSEAEDLLHLADEPEADNQDSGTTYGEMALLLNAYSSMLITFFNGKLRTK